MASNSRRAASNTSNTSIAGPGGVGKACRFCGRAFAKTEHLIRHERCHTKERPFQCSICGKNYSRNDTLIRHRRTHGNNTATVPQNVFNDNNTATTTDPSDIPPTTPISSRMPSSHRPMSSISSSIATSDFTAQEYDTSPVDFNSMGNEMYGHELYSPAELGPVSFSQLPGGGPAMPQIDPSLTGGRVDNLGAGNHMDFSASYLDPALQQYPPHSDNNAFAMGQMPYTAPEVDQFPSWYLAPDFDLAVFNKTFKAPTATEFFGVSSTTLLLNSHDMPSPDTGGELSLQTEWEQDLVPDVDFMNVSIQFFLTRFNPIFPIFHGPTFRPADHSPLLLLSISSIGSLLINNDESCLRGAKMFETIHKTVSESWANAESMPPKERTSFIQAALLSQIFAYLCGSPKYLALVKSFHVNLIDLARRCGILDITRTLPDVTGKASPALDAAWNSWAREEEISRTALGLYIHDAQFANTFHNAPILQHNALRLFVASTDELFAATTPTRWAHLLRLSPEPSKLSTHLHVNQPEHVDTAPLSKELSCRESRYSCYVILHSIGASVKASRIAGTLTPKQSESYEEALICWYHAYEQTRTTQDPDPLCLMVLYHEIFMALLVDFDQLENAIGGTSTPEGVNAIAYARTWSTSIEAKRCIIHASLIHGQCEGIPYHCEPALHVPRSMFLAARAWYCYIQFDPLNLPLNINNPSVPPPQQLTYEELLNIPEVKMFNADPMQYLPAVNGFGTGKPQLTEAATLCRLADLLEGIGRWGLSRRFAKILRGLIYGPGGNVGVVGGELGQAIIG
ncbi:hypothetical protein VTL71DRAFT_13346 [Oculimacula yallundae]|uniref:C2H2-type domain-containing protein n=1 Tax=Oculimacula yallundae TaxID=86028 RepID=A0ABR4CK73_9HELO